MRTEKRGFVPLLTLDDGVEVGASTELDSEKTLDDAQFEKKPDSLLQLEKLVTEREGLKRELKSIIDLIFLYVQYSTKKFLEIWCVLFLFFYADFFLDLRMMYTFWRYGDVWFMRFTIVGIAGGVLYTLAEFQNHVRTNDPSWMVLLCGFLLPFQLHVLFLCTYSQIYEDRAAHPLLHCFKLAESALEATISALIQSYALIFRHFETWDYMFGFLSCVSSYGSIAYCFCQLDRREFGLQGLPGIVDGWSWKMSLIFTFRACEVLSRLTSLALFQMAVRNETLLMGYSLKNTGAVCVIAFDILVMLLLIAFFQGLSKSKEHRNWFNCVYSPLSVIVFMNPLLSRDNAFTIPCSVYYSVRAFELVGMGALAWKVEVFHGGGPNHHREVFDHNPDDNLKSLAGFRREFCDDSIVLWAFFIATVLMYTLLPIIRCFSVHVMLHDTRMFTAVSFGPAQIYLRDKLLKVEGKKGQERQDCATFHRLCKQLIGKATNRMHRSVTEKNSEDGNEDNTPSQIASQSVDAQSLAGCSGVLENWLDRQLAISTKEWNAARSFGELFEELSRVGSNLHNWLKGEDGYFLCDRSDEESLRVQERSQRGVLYLKYLEVVAEAISPTAEAEAETEAVMRLEKKEVVTMILKVLPRWAVRDAFLNQDLHLIQEKCNIIARIFEIGWTTGRAFQPLALKLQNAFDVKTREGIMELTTDNTAIIWILRVQMAALLTMYKAIPAAVKKTKLKNDEEGGFFRKRKEIRAVMDAADIVMKERGTELEGSLNIEELGKGANFTKLNRLTKAVDLIKAAFKTDDMYFAPSWDKRLDTNRALGIMTTVHTRLKLVRIVKRFKDGEVMEIDIKNIVGLMTLLPSSADLASMMPSTELWGVELKFHFQYLGELENQPLDRLKLGADGWAVHDTAMLSLFTALGRNGEDVMKDLCGKDDPLVADFVRYRDSVEKSAREALDHKYNLLHEHGEKFVNPKTAVVPAFREFRSDFKGKKSASGKFVGIVDIGRLKNQNYMALKDYEKLHDSMKEFLRKLNDKFFWSSSVQEHKKGTEKKMDQGLDALRKVISDYWNEQERLVTEAAQQKEQQALEAAKAAEVKKQEAIEKEQEALKKSRQKEEEAQKAEDEAKNAQERARLEEEKAHNAEQEAKLAAERARSLEEKAKYQEERAAAMKLQLKLKQTWAEETSRNAKIQMDKARAEQAKVEQERDKAKQELETAYELWAQAEQEKISSQQRLNIAIEKETNIRVFVDKASPYVDRLRAEGTLDDEVNRIFKTLQGLVYTSV